MQNGCVRKACYNNTAGSRTSKWSGVDVKHDFIEMAAPARTDKAAPAMQLDVQHDIYLGGYAGSN